MVVDSIEAVQAGDLVLHLEPGWLALSAIIALATYCVLIWSWLYIVQGMDGRAIPFLAGARIWFISGLGTLLPGRIWGIVQMAAMSTEAGISAVAATASSIINAAVNIATGMAVAAIAGAQIIAAYYGERAPFAWAVAGLAAIGVIALPLIIPWAFRTAGRFGLKVPDQDAPTRAIAVSVAANVVSWFLYGAALLCLNRAVVDPAASSVVQHTAVFATSYVLGYLAIVVPAGMAVREKTLQSVMLAAQMATPAGAVALSVVSRLWLLILLVLPALIFLAYRRPRNEKDSTAG